jgi:hypothetical protein
MGPTVGHVVRESRRVIGVDRIFLPPTLVERACDQVDAWLQSPSLTLLGEDESYWPELRTLVLDGQIYAQTAAVVDPN